MYNMKMAKISAVIFDLDGTVIDNEKDWEAAFAAVADKEGLMMPDVKLTVNGWWHEPGLGIERNWKSVLHSVKREAADTEVRRLSDLTRREYLKGCEGKDVVTKSGIVEAVEFAKSKGWQTALCTGSTWIIAEKELEALGLQLAFDVTTTGEEVLMSKPDPEIYLLTAQKLGVEPDECLVVEDAVAGARAALEVEMKVINLVSEYATEEELRGIGVDFMISDFAELTSIFGTFE